MTSRAERLLKLCGIKPPNRKKEPANTVVKKATPPPAEQDSSSVKVHKWLLAEEPDLNENIAVGNGTSRASTPHRWLAEESDLNENIAVGNGESRASTLVDLPSWFVDQNLGAGEDTEDRLRRKETSGRLEPQESGRLEPQESGRLEPQESGRLEPQEPLPKHQKADKSTQDEQRKSVLVAKRQLTFQHAEKTGTIGIKSGKKAATVTRATLSPEHGVTLSASTCRSRQQGSLPLVTMQSSSADDLLPSFFIEEDVDGDLNDVDAAPEFAGVDNIDVPHIETMAAIDINSTTPSPATSASTTPASRKKTRRARQSPNDPVRKRPCNPSMWRIQQSKQALNTGLAHVTPAGKERRARKMGPGCPVTCKRCQKPRITEEERDKIFTSFWSLGSHARHWDYLTRHITIKKPVESTALPGKGKQTSRTHFFKVNGKPVKVCKTMFLHTLDISDKWIESALKKVEKGGNLSPDKRGTHQNRPHRTSDLQKQSIRQHINLFPRIQSHYTRENSKREYVETGLSVQKMYKLYQQWATEENITKVASCRQYREVFVREFNIGFFKPRKDQCLTCTRWKTSKDHEREKLQKEYENHLKNKSAVNKLKKEDKLEAETNKGLCVACFDLQKVLTVPRSEVSVMFYRNKISLYNFTVFDLDLRHGYCFMWNETQAKRGANEVASNLGSFIELKVSKGYKEFKFYSDAPSGQNRNRFVFSSWLNAAVKYKIKITHRFLESGHSYSEVDSMHARIEAEATRREIFSCEEWFSLIKNAKQSGEKYEVFVMTQDKCFDFHDLVAKQNWDCDSQKRKILWSKVREVRADFERPNTLFFKYHFDDEESELVVTQKRGHPVNLSTYQAPLAYSSKIPLKEKKIADIKCLLKEGAIPSAYHGFYEELISAPAVECFSNQEDGSDADHSEADES